MYEIYPILLAGGFGTRLWPLSRKTYPKQFSMLFGELTLFQSSAERLVSSETLNFAPHITLTNADFRFIIGEQLQAAGIDPGPILIEPEAKNTAASILAASVYAQSKDENAVLLVAPSDHVIPEKHDFHAAVKIGLAHVHDRKMVTFGIKPTHPETGYGYLEKSKDAIDVAGTSTLKNFKEKPTLKDATQMVETGRYLWNAGIFLFRAQDMIAAFQTYAPGTLELVRHALDEASSDLGFLRLSAEPWSKIENVSIDYAIMEKAQNLVVVPYASKWSDLGGWDAVWAESDQDFNGNVLSKTAHAIDCHNSLLRSESGNQTVIGIGLEDIVAVAMQDAVLVARKDRAQDVKLAVELLKSKDIKQAENSVKDYRPWGWFESLALGANFQVKTIYVNPKGALSLQSHKYRSEHWVVVVGRAKVTINEKTMFVEQGESTYIPCGELHRLENCNAEPLILIEVQIGSYLGEDDIIRYEDIYRRGTKEG